MKKKYLILFLILWAGLWIFLIARNLFIKGIPRSYKMLLSRSFEGKRSYVAGDSLYEFLNFCNDNMPEGAGYKLLGVDDESIERRRAVYYLYPHLEGKDLDFILVYNKPKADTAELKGYYLYRSLDEDRYMMKKKGSQ
jgi:hypothetical protein